MVYDLGNAFYQFYQNFKGLLLLASLCRSATFQVRVAGVTQIHSVCIEVEETVWVGCAFVPATVWILVLILSLADQAGQDLPF